ncbi:MAG: hypothetical protein WC509_00810 [Candidatus Izemoplasmatales bacterium]
MNVPYALVLTTGVVVLIVVACVIAVALAGLLAGTLFARRKRRPEPIPDERIEKILALLGGTENVLSAAAEGGRATFALADLKKADLAAIQALGATGVTVAGKTVKALFPFYVGRLVERFPRKD